MDASRSVTLHYSEKLLRAAVRAHLFRLLGGRFFFIALFAFSGCLVSLGWKSWMTNAAPAVLLIALLFVAAIIANHRRTLGIFRSMEKPEAVFSYDEDSFTASSDLGSSTIPWRRITGVLRRPDFWLLYLSPSQFITLPVADCSSQDLAFIESRIKENASLKKPS